MKAASTLALLPGWLEGAVATGSVAAVIDAVAGRVVALGATVAATVATWVATAATAVGGTVGLAGAVCGLLVNTASPIRTTMATTPTTAKGSHLDREGRSALPIMVASEAAGSGVDIPISVGCSVASVSLAFSRAVRISAADWKRSFGFLASAFSTSRSTESGRVLLNWRGMGSGSLMCLRMTAYG